jgi:hypothetical protein
VEDVANLRPSFAWAPGPVAGPRSTHSAGTFERKSSMPIRRQKFAGGRALVSEGRRERGLPGARRPVENDQPSRHTDRSLTQTRARSNTPGCPTSPPASRLHASSKHQTGSTSASGTPFSSTQGARPTAGHAALTPFIRVSDRPDRAACLLDRGELVGLLAGSGRGVDGGLDDVGDGVRSGDE